MPLRLCCSGCETACLAGRLVSMCRVTWVRGQHSPCILCLTYPPALHACLVFRLVGAVLRL